MSYNALQEQTSIELRDALPFHINLEYLSLPSMYYMSTSMFYYIGNMNYICLMLSEMDNYYFFKIAICHVHYILCLVLSTQKEMNILCFSTRKRLFTIDLVF